MKYIITITVFCEPDNNTPASRTYIKIIKANSKVQALDLAQDIEREIAEEDDEVMDSHIDVKYYMENMLIPVGETWG